MSETHVERRRRLLRDDIGRIAIDMFADRGFDEVTVDDIAEAAGISQRTFFRYFTSKDSIVLDFARRVDQRLVDAFSARPANEDAVVALRNAYVETSHVEPEDRLRIVQISRVLALTPKLEAMAHGESAQVSDALITKVAKRMGVRPSDQRARILVTAATAVVTVEFQRWADGGGKGDPSEVIAAAFDLLVAGFRSTN